MVGAALVVAFALTRGGSFSLSPGDAQLILVIISGAIAYTASGSLTREMPGWEVISWTLVASLPLSLLGCWLTFPANAISVPADAWLAVIYSAVFAQWMGFFFWNAGLAMGGISRVSQVQLLQPFVTVALAALVNHESVDLQTILFAAAVVVTVGGRDAHARRKFLPLARVEHGRGQPQRDLRERRDQRDRDAHQQEQRQRIGRRW